MKLFTYRYEDEPGQVTRYIVASNIVEAGKEATERSGRYGAVKSLEHVTDCVAVTEEVLV